MEPSARYNFLLIISATMIIISIIYLIYNGIMYFRGERIHPRVINGLIFVFILGVTFVCMTSEIIIREKNKIKFDNALQRLEQEK